MEKKDAARKAATQYSADRRVAVRVASLTVHASQIDLEGGATLYWK